jgi:hypothetical protein
MFELEESAMLGPDGIPGSGAEAIGGDVVAELLERIKDGARADNNGGGNGGGRGGGGGENPYNAPVNVHMLLAAARVIAEAMSKIGEMNLKATETMTDATIDAIGNPRDGVLSVVKQIHESSMSVSNATVDRIERVEEPKPDAFMVAPRYADGTQGPPIFLREMFAACDAQTRPDEEEG